MVYSIECQREMEDMKVKSEKIVLKDQTFV
jgi:hypothetical protein